MYPFGPRLVLRYFELKPTVSLPSNKIAIQLAVAAYSCNLTEKIN